MKLLLNIIALLFSVITINAQSFLVPYRVGDKFGLANEKGKIKVDPIYDEVNYLGGKYFQFTKNNVSTDTIKKWNGEVEIRETKDEKTSLYSGDIMLISGQEYTSFFVYDSVFIIGSKNNFRPEHCVLFNMKGELVIKDEAKSIAINDSRDVGKLKYASNKFVLLTIFPKDKSRKRTYKRSIAVYDRELQKISQWLIEDASSDYKIIPTGGSELDMYCSYTDAYGMPQNKHIYFDSEKALYVLQNGKPSEVIEDDIYEISDRFSNEFSDETVIEMPSDYIKKKAKPILFKSAGDSVLYYNGEAIPNKNGVKYLLSYYKGQPSPVIFKQKNKYGIVLSNTEQVNAIYDSLSYYTSYKSENDEVQYIYFAGMKDTKTSNWKYGLIAPSGKELVPIIYDSLLNYIPEIHYDYNHDSRFFSTKKPNQYSSMSKSLVLRGMYLVHSKNKYGIVDRNNKTIIPIKYDAIYNNGLGSFMPVKKRNNFLILKDDGKFTFLEYEKLQGKKCNYPKMPSHLILNYYGIKDFDLLILVDEQGFFCFANKNGAVYYKEK